MSLTPGISWPGVNLGRVLAQVNQAEAISDEARARYEQSFLLALEETEEALARVTAAKQRRDYFKISVEQSGKAVAIARTQYENGLIDLLPVLDAQRTALLAQLELVGSETNLLRSVVQLFKTLDGAWNDTITTNQKNIRTRRDRVTVRLAAGSQAESYTIAYRAEFVVSRPMHVVLGATTLRRTAKITIGG